jgi:chromosome segregation ATPase
MTPFFSKKEIRELEEKRRIEKKSLEKEILDLKTRHAAEVDQHRKAFDDRTTLINLKLKEAAKERTRHDTAMAKLQEEMAKATHAWKAYCDKLQKEHNDQIREKLLGEGERTKKITGLEKALAKHKENLATYKRRLGNALKTLDGKKEQVAKLRTELAALSSEAHQDP